MKTLSLTTPTGTPVTVNLATIAAFAPAAAADDAGTVITFGFSAGDKKALRRLKVIESYGDVGLAMKASQKKRS